MQNESGHFSGVRPTKIDVFAREEKQFSCPAPRPAQIARSTRKSFAHAPNTHVLSKPGIGVKSPLD
jgi:hypothetical protein